MDIIISEYIEYNHNEIINLYESVGQRIAEGVCANPADAIVYIDKLNELDTTGVEPMSHVFPVENVMREDVVTNGDGSEATLANAPERKEDAFVVTLEIKGKLLTSEELADKIETLGIQGTSHIIFIIGGSIGLGNEVLKRSNYALSFSKMTFPHQLMRVILLEQIYRSYRIINHEPYHK